MKLAPSDKSDLPVSLQVYLIKEQNYVLALRQCANSNMMAIRKRFKPNSNSKPKRFDVCLSFGLRSNIWHNAQTAIQHPHASVICTYKLPHGSSLPNPITTSHKIPNIASSKLVTIPSLRGPLCFGAENYPDIRRTSKSADFSGYFLKWATRSG